MQAQHLHEDWTAVAVMTWMVDVLQPARCGHASPEMSHVVGLDMSERPADSYQRLADTLVQ